jgi:hypothetical protein
VKLVIGHPLEAGLLHHAGEGPLVGEAADALDQVLIGVAVLGDPLADLRDDLEAE